jgi:oligopeptide transport system substrate-binding protein
MTQPVETGFLLSVVLLLLFSIPACEAVESPKGAAYYSKVAAPVKRELRWSNGGTPKHLDPAFAAAPPEKDIVRAVYEGLTSLDPASLKAVPAIAESWESSDDHKQWTFRLRKEARWSNGDPIKAADLIRSWKRVASLGKRPPNHELLLNIRGVKEFVTPSKESNANEDPFLSQTGPALETPSLSPSPLPLPSPADNGLLQDPSTLSKNAPVLGFEELDEYTLRISLVDPDPAFPRLLADPIFFPIHRTDIRRPSSEILRPSITNGPFAIQSVSDGIVSVTRSDSYWNSRSVVLDKIDFVSMPTAETALQAYRGGELDVVTNANFEPLALKILAPYEDFRTSVHSALNFYEFNVTTAPFSDRRVRLALAISVDREKLANAELGGSVEPAYSLLPLSESKEARYEYNVDAARSSLAAAGFPDGKGFPTVRLVVNRNNVQQRIASAVAKMWKSELNIETEIIVKDASEMRSLRESGDYHLIRRGVVLPSPSETASLMLIFDKYPDPINTLEPAHSSSAEPSPSISADRNNITPTPSPAEGNVITERSAIYDVHAIPLYFPRSYALVQPYVRGFDLNGIDSPDIGSLSIDSSW